MRISDWSSDMCSSDLSTRCRINVGGEAVKQHFLDVSEFVGLQHLMDRSQADLVAGSIKVCFSLSFRDVGFADFACRRYEPRRSEEQTSELQSLMRSSYAVFCLKKKKRKKKKDRE